MIFQDRADAGKKLGRSLIPYRGPDTVVYALPRGGVVVAAEVVKILGAPLDLIVVRKIGHPQSPEYAIAAVAEDGRTVENASVVASVDRKWFAAEVRAQQEEARRRSTLYLAGRRPVGAKGKVAIVVDDGLATGLSMFLAVKQVRLQKPVKIVVAVPVAAEDSVEKLRSGAAAVDAVVALYVPEMFMAIGSFYRDFEQVCDDEVIRLVRSSNPLSHLSAT
jgi:predicted phosphoribosyltransferase